MEKWELDSDAVDEVAISGANGRCCQDVYNVEAHPTAFSRPSAMLGN